jgi:mannitol/fructose-specific phosphotransferase system IIA component (Ntr-type)
VFGSLGIDDDPLLTVTSYPRSIDGNGWLSAYVEMAMGHADPNDARYSTMQATVLGQQVTVYTVPSGDTEVAAAFATPAGVYTVKGHLSLSNISSVLGALEVL